MSQLKVAVDIMGGDRAPQAVCHAVIAQALKQPNVTFYAVGLAEILAQYFTTRPSNVVIVPSETEVMMSMSAPEACRMGKSSSIGKMIDMLKEGEVESALSCGNTAALMSLAYLMLKPQEGVRRPAILSSVSFQGKQIHITDLGANIQVKSEDLLSNAKIASQLHCDDLPSIGLLNVGKEAEKGTAIIKEADLLLKESGLNYKGFIEGHDILQAKVDIVVCDGFVGNCLTKLLESMSALLKQQNVNEELLPRFHKAALLAGLNGRVYKAHGDSSQLAIEEAIIGMVKQLEIISV